MNKRDVLVRLIAGVLRTYLGRIGISNSAVISTIADAIADAIESTFSYEIK